jgi:hypothetical protein
MSFPRNFPQAGAGKILRKMGQLNESFQGAWLFLPEAFLGLRLINRTIPIPGPMNACDYQGIFEILKEPCIQGIGGLKCLLMPTSKKLT